jgi:DNA processing protein
MVISDVARQWLGIISARGVGFAEWIDLSRSIPPGEILRRLESETERERLGRRFKRPVGAPDPAFAGEQMRLLERGGYGLVSISDEAYPRLLREIPAPPPLLFFEGDCAALSRPAVCIVGSRHSSRRGLVTAGDLARELSERGVHVVSGLARGIDGAAHTGALAGAGGTSAVLGCGVDVVYPPEHGPLARRIVAAGCVLSELPLGTKPMKHHFPLRNRIMSALSLGVVVVEAGLDSGAMGTALWALEQNREVFAVPGPIDCTGSRGPHHLIRQGATLVESVEDILAGLPAAAGLERAAAVPTDDARSESLTRDERAVLSTLDLEPKHIDELVRFCHIPPTILLPLLLDLEMRGIVESCGAGTYALASPGTRSSGTV